jgi:type II secretion system protein H
MPRCFEQAHSSPSAAKRSPGLPGFTLVELMVVIVLIGILSAMILPNMKGTYGDAMLRSTGRDLVNAFSLAYSRAVSLNEVHRVRLDALKGHYVIEKQVREGPNEFLQVKDVAGCEGDLDKRVSIQIRNVSDDAPTGREAASPTPTQSVTFYPDGTADGSEVLLRDREGFRLGLKVDAVTARVQILELGRE